MDFKFVWKGKMYVIADRDNNAFSHIVLKDTREVLTVTGWGESYPPVIKELKKVPHDFQESLAEELALIFEAPIASLAALEDEKRVEEYE